MTEYSLPLNSCACCGSGENLEMHHIVPGFCNWFEETDTIPLCEVHHAILHNMLGKFFFLNVSRTKELLIPKLKEYTLWFCKFEWQNACKELGKDREYFKNHCVFCRKPSRFMFWDYERDIGLFGLCANCTKWVDGSYKAYWETIKKEEGKGDKSI